MALKVQSILVLKGPLKFGQEVALEITWQHSLELIGVDPQSHPPFLVKLFQNTEPRECFKSGLKLHSRMGGGETFH